MLRSDFGFEDFVSRFCYTLFDGLTPAAELQLTQVRSFVYFSFKVLCISARMPTWSLEVNHTSHSLSLLSQSLRQALAPDGDPAVRCAAARALTLAILEAAARGGAEADGVVLGVSRVFFRRGELLSGPSSRSTL